VLSQPAAVDHQVAAVCARMVARFRRLSLLQVRLACVGLLARIVPRSSCAPKKSAVAMDELIGPIVTRACRRMC